MKDLLAELDLAQRRVARLSDHEGAGIDGDVYDVRQHRPPPTPSRQCPTRRE